MKAKNANIELIRIVAMVLVVVHHFFRHGGDCVARLCIERICGVLEHRRICVRMRQPFCSCVRVLSGGCKV